jgi:hypothetical protein
VSITIQNGVAVVENPGLHLADSLAWSIDTANAVVVGALDGPAESAIGRTAGVLLRTDGAVVIADALAHEVRLHDEHGRLIRKAGRVGEGPGEYNWMETVLPWAGDSIAVVDHEGARVTILDSALEFVRQYNPRFNYPGAASHDLVGSFPDGQAVVGGFLGPCRPGRSEGVCVDSVAFYRTNETGTPGTDFGRFVHSRRESFRVAPGAFSGWSEPHPQAFWRVHGERFYYADAKRFEFRVFRADGVLERIVRVAADPPRHDRTEVFAPLALTVGNEADERMREAARMHNNALSKASLPDTLPFFSDLHVDADGYVWIREYVPPDSALRPRWFIFDPEGRLRYALRSPTTLVRRTPAYSHGHIAFGTDRVIAVATGEMGVDILLIYRLTKSTPRRTASQ